MARLKSFYDIDVGLAKAANWAQPQVVEKFLNCQSLTPSSSSTRIEGKGTGAAFGLAQAIKKGPANKTVALATEGTYWGAMWNVVAAYMGGYTLGGEQTAGEGDILHTMAHQSASEFFQTLAYLQTPNHITELTTVLYDQLSLTLNAAQKIQMSANGIVEDDPYSGAPIDVPNMANTVADLAALADPTIDIACLAEDGMYVRVGPFSDTVPLDASHELEVQGVTLNFQRSYSSNFVTRGANTNKPSEPQSSGDSTVSMTLNLDRYDDAEFDPLKEYRECNELMAEIYFQGDPIGAGLNRSVRIRLPKLFIGDSRPGNTGPQESDVFRPTMELVAGDTNIAPAGMAGVNSPTIEVVNTDPVNFA